MSLHPMKYIGFYANPAFQNQCRMSSPAADNKMDYICTALNRNYLDVNIISPSWTTAGQGFFRGGKVKLNERTNTVLFSTFGSKIKMLKRLKYVWAYFRLFLFLILHVERNETILVYHSQYLSWPVRTAKKIRRFRMILEVEEIYADVPGTKKRLDKAETELIDCADAYLFSTELLRDRVAKSAVNTVLYGSYTIPLQHAEHKVDGKIHLLYAGIIDSHKLGAFRAIEATKYLSGRYVLHIIGFGETEKLCVQIDLLNKTNTCKIVFDGLKTGDEYIAYCQNCDIGLSTQSMAGKYQNTSFPSKILSYLSMGLHVVSCETECVRKSAVGSLVSYYKEDTPEAIADTIMSVDLSQPYDSRNVIRELDLQFVEDIKKLL